MPTFPGTLDSLEPIRMFVAEAAKQAGLDSSAIYALCLAVDEVATNIITHGYDEAGQTGTIEVDTEIEDGALVVRTHDSSASYDPDEHVVSSDVLTSPLESRKIGGLGLFLVQDNVDEFRYERIGERNRHTFRKKVK